MNIEYVCIEAVTWACKASVVTFVFNQDGNPIYIEYAEYGYRWLEIEVNIDNKAW